MGHSATGWVGDPGHEEVFPVCGSERIDAPVQMIIEPQPTSGWFEFGGVSLSSDSP
jgi:hypothetical protein